MMWVFKTPASRLVRQASTLGIIPRSITPWAIKSRQPLGSQTPDQAGGFVLVEEDSGGVGQEDELFGLNRLGHGRGGGVGVDVQEPAFLLLVFGQRRQHGHDAGQAEVFDGGHVNRGDLADVAQVDRPFGPVFQPQLPAEQALVCLVVQARGPAAELIDVPLDVGVDLFGQHARDDRRASARR